jgi:hypothetical protein
MWYLLQVVKTYVHFEENFSIANKFHNFDFLTLIDKLLLRLKVIADLDAEMLRKDIVGS